MKITTLFTLLAGAATSSAAVLYTNDIETGSGLTLVAGTDPNTDPGNTIETFVYQAAGALGETPTAGTQGAVYWGQHAGMVHNLDFSLTGIAGQEVLFSMDTLWKNDNNTTYRNATFEIFSDDGAGGFSSLGTLTGTLPTPDPSSALGDGSFSTYTLNAGVLTDGDYRLQVTVGTTGNNGAFDNFVVETIPEPTSAALLGLGGLAFIARRRR